MTVFRRFRGRLRACLGTYSHAWWLPVTASTLTLGLFVVAFLVRPLGLLQVLLVLFLLFGASLLGIFVVAINRLVKRRWLAAGLQFAFLIGMLFVLRKSPLLPMLLIGPSEDGFADHLVIPADLAVTEPLEMQQQAPTKNADAFQAALVAAIAGSRTGDPSVSAGGLPSLAELQKRHPDILRRYLATSIAWRVYREHGEVFATRRWMVQGMQGFDLYGYETALSLDAASENSPRPQTRLTLVFSSRPRSGLEDRTILTSGKPVSVRLEQPFSALESACVLPMEGIAVDIFEKSTTKERRLTKATLRLLENEFRPLASNPNWETIQKLVPPGSIIEGDPSLSLRKSYSPGEYSPEIRVNPGEPGRIYLKAFEITRGTPLSVSDLEEYSNEYVGWSDDPRQQFFSTAQIMIDEGDWGKPYAARFEAWFVPNSGKRERKLLEKVFRIEGWQR